MNRTLRQATAVAAGLLSLASAALCQLVAPAVASTDCAPPDLARRALLAVNAQRAAGTQCGALTLIAAPALAWSLPAERAAAAHAQDMAGQGRMGHSGSDGSQGGERLRREGYVWASWGENLGQGHGEPSLLVAHWMTSPGHCANLMNPRLTDLGMACRQGPDGRPYWALTLARPAPLRAPAR